MGLAYEILGIVSGDGDMGLLAEAAASSSP
jgi:hypothetical protein